MCYTYSVFLCKKGGADFRMFYAKLALVLLLVIPVAVLGFVLFGRLVNHVLVLAKRDKENRMERERIDNTRSARRSVKKQKR